MGISNNLGDFNILLYWKWININIWVTTIYIPSSQKTDSPMKRNYIHSCSVFSKHILIVLAMEKHVEFLQIVSCV